MVKNTVEVIIRPVTLRFRLFKDEVYYVFASNLESQIDDAELMFGIDTSQNSLHKFNLGFVPVCSTVLIRGEKNILIDPNCAHIGFYGLLANALGQRNLSLSDIDVVVPTHWHHDHAAGVRFFKNGELVVGKGELDWARKKYGEEGVENDIKGYSKITETASDGTYEIAPGVTAVLTPGHTPGSISVFVEEENCRTIVAGDTITIRKEWDKADFSQWYTEEQLEQLHADVKIMRDWRPNRIIPGHDIAFTV